ncbi:MAG: hypothetical protein ABSG08_20180, partial [Terriglobales bacterium]
SNCCSSFPRMPSSYQVVLWKQESFVVLRPLHIEFFRNLLEVPFDEGEVQAGNPLPAPQYGDGINFDNAALIPACASWG